MKKVLLIGDLRTMVNNYGACATTQLLIDEIEKYDIQLSCIDARSMWSETPREGWSEDTQNYSKRVFGNSFMNERKAEIRHFLKSIPIVYYINNLYHSRNDIFLPYLYSQYEEYAKSVLDGTKFEFERNKIEEADIVLINGEGNIVKGTDPFGYYRLGGLYVLFVAYLAKIVLNKPTYLINHGVDPGNRDIIEIIRNIYPALDGVFVREKLSINLLAKWGITNTRFVADALFLFTPTNQQILLPKVYTSQRDYSKKLVCIGDSSGIQSPYSKVKWNVVGFYKSLIEKYQANGYQVAFVDGFNGLNYDVNSIVKKTKSIHLKSSNCSFKELYKVFQEAEIYVSGRWHTSILAIEANTPILLWGADSHKTEALYDLIDYKQKFFEVLSLPLHVDEIYNESIKAMSEYEREKVKTIVKELYDSAVDGLRNVLE